MSNQYRVDRFYGNFMYKDCTSSKSQGKRLYRFPLQTDKRHHLWIRNSGKFLYHIITYIQ